MNIKGRGYFLFGVMKTKTTYSSEGITKCYVLYRHAKMAYVKAQFRNQSAFLIEVNIKKNRYANKLWLKETLLESNKGEFPFQYLSKIQDYEIRARLQDKGLML